MGTTKADRRRTASIELYDVIDRPPRNELLATVELAARQTQVAVRSGQALCKLAK